MPKINEFTVFFFVPVLQKLQETLNLKTIRTKIKNKMERFLKFTGNIEKTKMGHFRILTII